jgi:hypothetical protein
MVELAELPVPIDGVVLGRSRRPRAVAACSSTPSEVRSAHSMNRCCSTANGTRGRLSSSLQCCVNDEVMAEAQEHSVGGKKLQSSIARLGDEEPVERVMLGELRKLAKGFGVLRCDAQ